MNRVQAGHLLDAYLELELVGGGDNARATLREVILDAMCGYGTPRDSGITVRDGSIRYPYATWVNTGSIPPSVVPQAMTTADSAKVVSE